MMEDKCKFITDPKTKLRVFIPGCIGMAAFSPDGSERSYCTCRVGIEKKSKKSTYKCSSAFSECKQTTGLTEVQSKVEGLRLYACNVCNAIVKSEIGKVTDSTSDDFEWMGGDILKVIGCEYSHKLPVGELVIILEVDPYRDLQFPFLVMSLKTKVQDWLNGKDLSFHYRPTVIP